MATDPRVLGDDTTVEAPVEERPAAPRVSYSAIVGSTCMLWMMILGLAFFAAGAIFWGITKGLSLLG